MPPSAHGRLNGRGGWCLPNRRHQLVKRQAAGVIPCDDAVAGNRSDRRGHYGYHCAHVAVGFIEGVAHPVDAPSRVHYGTFKPLLIRARERHDHVLLSHSASLPNERRTRTGQNQGVRTAGKKKPRPAPWEAPKSGAERAGSAEPTRSGRGGSSIEPHLNGGSRLEGGAENLNRIGPIRRVGGGYHGSQPSLSLPGRWRLVWVPLLPALNNHDAQVFPPACAPPPGNLPGLFRSSASFQGSVDHQQRRQTSGFAVLMQTRPWNSARTNASMGCMAPPHLRAWHCRSVMFHGVASLPVPQCGGLVPRSAWPVH